MNKRTIRDYMLTSDYASDTKVEITKRASASPYEPLCYTLWQGHLADIPEMYQALSADVSLSLVSGQLILELT